MKNQYIDFLGEINSLRQEFNDINDNFRNEFTSWNDEYRNSITSLFDRTTEVLAYAFNAETTTRGVVGGGVASSSARGNLLSELAGANYPVAATGTYGSRAAYRPRKTTTRGRRKSS